MEIERFMEGVGSRGKKLRAQVACVKGKSSSVQIKIKCRNLSGKCMDIRSQQNAVSFLQADDIEIKFHPL